MSCFTFLQERLVASMSREELDLATSQDDAVSFLLQTLLFTALLNRGAGDNSCYHPANCQKRVITLLSSAKCQERDDNSLL